MPEFTELIGTGEDYTSIQAWEDDLDNAHQHTGECKAEVFAIVGFSGDTYTATEYPHLTAQSGAEHDGRAHEVSAAGNARIEWAALAHGITVTDEYIRISWLEIKGPGNNGKTAFYLATSDVGLFHAHHCIVHNNHASASTSNYGIYLLNIPSISAYLYRNIIYGTGSSGIRTSTGAAGSVALCNTLYNCNSVDSSTHGGLRTGDTDYTIINNASFDNKNKDIRATEGTLDYNATSDDTGDDEGANGIANLVTADQFVAPTDTWADTDLLLKTGADLIDEGFDFSGDVGAYPEIDVSIDKGATRATIDGTWDIGASEFISEEPSVGFPYSQAIIIA